MKSIVVTFLVTHVATMSGFIACLLLEPPPAGLTTRAAVTRVIDGDTVEVEIRHRVRVRLLDCWCMESKADPRLPEDQRELAKARGLAAKQNLHNLCDGKEVILHVPTDGSGDVSKLWTMGRVLGRVWVDGSDKSVNELQVESGHATVNKPEELQ